MKSIKIFSVCLAALLGLSSCASSWLDQELTGSTLTQEEYNSLNNTAIGTVRGTYASLYLYGGSHDAFGQKSLDLSTDLMSCDLAMTAQAYGWFTSDAQRLTQNRTGYAWSLYFGMIMNVNAVLRSLDKKASLTYEEQGAYAQALAIRAFCYYNLANLYGPAAGDLSTPSVYGKKGYGPEYDIAPYYTQNDTTPAGLVKEKPLENYITIRNYVNDDLDRAIEMFDACEFVRTSKLYIDGDLARAIQAYNCLQMGWAAENPTGIYQKGLQRAQEVIATGNYTILPFENVLTTGFVDVSNPSWMWGLDVTAENSTGLASFWGHMDVHTYSYAYAGATKGCDDVLFKQISRDDIRRQWFDTTKKYIPDWKFYDLNRGVTADEIDRDWKNDIVYMRIEEMYLVAAECAHNIGDDAQAKSYLKDLLKERIIDYDSKTEAKIDAWSTDEFMNELYLNWRIEMFAEGRALMTFKRFYQYGSDFQMKKVGTTNFALSGQDVHGNDYNILFTIPSSEVVYNNEIAD